MAKIKENEKRLTVGQENQMPNCGKEKKRAGHSSHCNGNSRTSCSYRSQSHQVATDDDDGIIRPREIISGVPRAFCNKDPAALPEVIARLLYQHDDEKVTCLSFGLNPMSLFWIQPGL